MRPTRSAVAAIVLAAVLAWLPTANHPWNNTDAPNHVDIVRGLSALPLGEVPRALLHAGAFAGLGGEVVFNPGLWVIQLAAVSAVGLDPLPHRVMRLVVFVLVALWVFVWARRSGAGDGWALAAALGFLAFPAPIENWQYLPTSEPAQVVALAALAECLYRGWGLAACVALAAAVSLKQTSWCAAGLLAAALVMRVRGAAAVAAFALALLATYVAAMPPATGWVSAYVVTPERIAGGLAQTAWILWRDGVLLVPLGALGALALLRRDGAHRLPALLLLGWCAAGIAILTPWRAPSTRYAMLYAAPLAALVAAGLAELARIAPWRGWPRAGVSVIVAGTCAWIAMDACVRVRPVVSGALGVMSLGALMNGFALARVEREAVLGWARTLAVWASAAWLAGSFALSMRALCARETASDVPLRAAVELVLREIPPGDAIWHPCRAPQGASDWAVWLERHVQAFGPRPGFKLRPRPEGARWIVLAPHEPDVDVGGGAELVLDVSGESVERPLPDAKTALRAATRALICPHAEPLLPPGYPRVWRWRIYRVRS